MGRRGIDVGRGVANGVVGLANFLRMRRFATLDYDALRFKIRCPQGLEGSSPSSAIDMQAHHSWAFPGGDGGYDLTVDAYVERGTVRFVETTRNPVYGGASGLGTFTFAELLEKGPPDPLSRELCTALLADVAAALETRATLEPPDDE